MVCANCFMQILLIFFFKQNYEKCLFSNITNISTTKTESEKIKLNTSFDASEKTSFELI